MCLACDNLCCISAATSQCGCNECPEEACHRPDEKPDNGDPGLHEAPPPQQLREAMAERIRDGESVP
jgi:hypothetical protein